MDGRIIERLKKRVGTRNDEEINELAMSCVRELENTGVYGDPATDALYYQAMVLYCKANFGYDENTERFQTAFEKLRDSMALSGDSVGIDDPALAAEEKLAVVLGTEGDGLAGHTIADCDYTVCIPMSHGVDSLNVAAASAVAFWQLGRNNCTIKH